MTNPFQAAAKELFKRQIKHKKNRYMLDVPFLTSERLNWIGSKHWALMEKRFSEKMGIDYYVDSYYIAKIWGHMFCSRVSSLVKTKRLVATVLASISEELGFGKVIIKKLGYKTDRMTFSFQDIPISREYAKLFGFTDFPIDFVECGLVCGSIEHLLERNFIVFESSCVGQGDAVCNLEAVGLDEFEDFLNNKIKNKKYKEIYSKIFEIEKKTDFRKEASKIYDNQNKKAIKSENDYLQNYKSL